MNKALSGASGRAASVAPIVLLPVLPACRHAVSTKAQKTGQVSEVGSLLMDLLPCPALPCPALLHTQKCLAHTLHASCMLSAGSPTSTGHRQEGGYLAEWRCRAGTHRNDGTPLRVSLSLSLHSWLAVRDQKAACMALLPR